METIVWLIEDNAEEADQYGRSLQKLGENSFTVQFVPVRPSVADYGDLLSNQHTGAFIFDQRLREGSGVNYDGIEAAEFLRTIRPEIPIFILTQHGDDDLLKQKEEFADFVMDKGDIAARNHRAQIYVTRLLRHLGQYESVLTHKQKRLKELIDRKLSFGLNETETTELTSLRADIERPSASLITQQEANWAKEHQQQEQLLTQLKDLTKTLQELGKQQGA